MKSLRRWQFNGEIPYSLRLASDARLGPTDYSDDQIWEVMPGTGSSPALALQTHYGNRAGLVSLVPMWLHEGRPIYQAQAYAKPPTLTGFAPNYLRLQATLTSQLALQAEYWAMESHAVGAQFTIANAHTEPIALRFEMVGFVGIGGKEQQLIVVPLSDGSDALSLGKIANLQPAVVFAVVPSSKSSQALSPGRMKAIEAFKIGQDFVIEGRKKLVIRFVHAALPSLPDSLALAQKWLATDWSAAFQKIEAAAQLIPDIQTGDDAADAAIAFSYHQLMQAFLKPTANLPFASFVATRKPERGFTARADGENHDRGWNGQAPTLAYPVALATASIDPNLAQGIIRNYLAIQQTDGWIDGRPGLGGQKQGALAMPILARLSWGIFQYTDDQQFLHDIFPGLMKFFARWFQPDMDKDGDSLPEWQTENQTGYVFTPTFAAWQGWAQGADIRLVESPDLAAYLLSEARSLKEIAYFLGERDAERQWNDRIAALSQQLESLWNTEKGFYTYRDRDTHTTTAGTPIIHGAHGGDELLPAQALTPPNRLIVRIAGGVDLVPRMTLKLEGLDSNGKPANESVSSSDFLWGNGRGVYTSQSVFARIDRLTFDGLSRVYKIEVNTMDTTALDINALLPLWSGSIYPERANALLNLMTAPDQFWRTSGVSMNSAKDAHFDPTNANGSGGVWPFSLTLIGEALVELGEMQKATELLKNILKTQITVLKKQKDFSEFYHADQPIGLGETGHLAGIVPLYLLLRIFGVQIISTHKVIAGGEFFWDKPVTIRQRGVTVRRAKEGTQITFPSGYEVKIPGSKRQEIIDPNA